MGRVSEPGVIDINSPALSHLSSPATLGIFELIRRHRRGASLAELRVASGLALPEVTVAVDSLASAGVIDRVPARGKRSTRYRALCEEFTILADHRIPAEVKAVRRHFDRSTAAMASALADSQAIDRPMKSAEQRIDARVPLDLSRTEMLELRRLLRGVFDFLENLRLSRRLDGSSADSRCKHVLDLRVWPADPPVLPLPGIRLASRDVHGSPPGASVQADLGISAREREAATLAAQGLRRKEIARRLGVSQNTVATLLQRTYRKLGITSRTRLRDKLSRTPLVDQ